MEEKQNQPHGITLKEYLKTYSKSSIKLHLGCGGMRWKDFINVDLYPYDSDVNDTSRTGCIAEAFADMRHLELPDKSIDEIFTSHTLEHFTRWETFDMIQDWHRMLRSNGKLIIEMPDFWRCVFWLFHLSAKKRRLARSQFYGNQWNKLQYETHRYVWSKSEFKNILQEIGFSHIRITHRTKTHFSGRDMHIEAIK